MAEGKRKSIFTPSVSRTLERIAIAALAALTARGSESSIAIAIVTIFVIVVMVEELGRIVTIRGERTTLRDVAISKIGRRRLRRDKYRGNRRRRKRRVKSREVAGDSISSAADTVE